MYLIHNKDFNHCFGVDWRKISESICQPFCYKTLILPTKMPFITTSTKRNTKSPTIYKYKTINRINSIVFIYPIDFLFLIVEAHQIFSIGVKESMWTWSASIATDLNHSM